jgi:membrane-associated phospholipid phosphatase
VKHLDRAARRSAAVFLAVAILAFFTAALIARAETFSELDRGARAYVRTGRSPGLAPPMRFVSLLGSGYVLLPVTVACSVALWRRRHRAVALSLPAIGAGAALALAATKWIVNKPRPSLRGYGFPSGHVFGVTVFVVMAVYLLWMFDTPPRVQRAARTVGIVFVLVVGYSRLYVNAHWLSDVVGGLLAGLAFALLMVLTVDGRCGLSGAREELQ